MIPKAASFQQFEQSVLRTIDREQLLPSGSRIGVAVSGGADSVALFRILTAYAAEREWEIAVVHVNHKLRGVESDEDAAFVQELAQSEELLCKIYVSPVPDSSNLEQNARALRQDCFRDFALSLGLSRVALGHSRSDQAETVLFRFLRGSGSAGLAGIPALTADGLVRPLLDQTRDGVRDYLRQLGQPWREDSSNASLAFDRNRIRLELLPALARDWNPQIEATLAQTAEWARAEEAYWASIIGTFSREHFQIRPGPSVIFPREAIRKNEANLDFSVAVARRVVRHAVRLVRGDLLSIDFQHVEAILALFREKEGSGRLQIPGVDILRSFDWVRFAPLGSYGAGRDFEVAVQIPGRFALPAANSFLLLQIQDSDSRYNHDVDWLDWDRIPGALAVRAWRPGDRFRQRGHDSETKLKSLFQDARIPLWDRSGWPVLVMGDAIVWTRRFGAAAGFAAGPSTRRTIRVTEKFAEVSDSSVRNRNQESGGVRL